MTRRPRPTGRRLAWGLFGLTAACARPARFPPPPRDPSIAADTAPAPAPARPAPLRVENRGRQDIVVYAVRGSVRTRLGTVTASTTQALTIPTTFVNDAGGFYLIADAVGGRTPLRSEQVIVRTGQRVVWTVETSAARSSIGVY